MALLPDDFIAGLQSGSEVFGAIGVMLAWTAYTGWATFTRRWLHFGIAAALALAWIAYLTLTGEPAA